MRKILFFNLIFLWCFQTAKPQSCVPTTINGTVINLACGQVCTNFVYQVPHLKSTSDYIATTTPYAAYPNNAGTQIPSIYIDDKFSPLIPMAFPFCFYGLNYNNIVVGSNGMVTFEALCANQNNAYTLTVGGLPQPLPYAGGAGPSAISTTYYPRTAIMGVYQDIDPSQTPLPTRSIEYNVFGTAPCRKFVVSFVDIRMFSCTGLVQTTQIVMHESTGLIEVFSLNKPLCTTWPSGAGGGLAILGIQDDTRMKFAAAPGKNCTQWNESNTGYRFVPNGGTSNFISAQLFTLGGVFVANADTTTTIAGILDISFPNICPPNVPTTTYVVQTTFNSCTGAPLISSDTITINRVTSLPANITTNPTTCGINIGSITITPTAGVPPYTYILNGGAPQTAPGPYTFSGLGAGNYTIVVTDVNGCTNNFNATIATTTTITGTINVTPTTCPLSTDGTLTVTPTSGTPPYNYSLDFGPVQSGNIFTNLAPGSHNVQFTDINNCTGFITFMIVAGNTPITANINTTGTSCPTVNNGTITVTPTSGTAPYQYSIDGGPFGAGNSFTNLASGSHTVIVKGQFGCTGNFNIIVPQGPALNATINTFNPPCANVNNGSITVIPTNGTAPYLYSLNGGPTQPSNVFSGLTPGSYTVTISDFIGCPATYTVTLTSNPAITATSTNVMPLCNSAPNGSITVNASGGVPPYQYSINNGITFQASALFNGLLAGPYNFIVRDAQGCVYRFLFILSEPPPTIASAIATPATCSNNDGIIDVTANGGTPAYQYSIDGGITWQPGTQFTGLASGNYNNIQVRDANGCIQTTGVSIPLNDTMRLSLGPDSTICVGSSLTLLPQTNDLTSIFKWRPPTGLNYDTIKNPIATPGDTTQYILTAKWGACQRTDTIVINVKHKPVAFAGYDTVICYKSFALLKGSASDLSGPVSFAWSPTTNVLPPNSPIAVARPDSTQIYVLTVTDNYGCNFSVNDSVFIRMEDPVPAFAGNDTIAILGVPHQLLGRGGVSYMWTPSANLNNPFAQNPLATLFNDTRFILTVTDAYGCKNTDDVFIKVYEGPTYYLPNAFSPNGDGHNDVFFPTPVGISQTDYFIIYNRLGEIVFQTTRWLNGWDGKYKGVDALTGTYVWIIKGKDKYGKVVEMKGTVLLLR